MSNGPMNMDEAHFLLDKFYREARENSNIYNPVAYSLYQVWKIADRRKRPEPKMGGHRWKECGDNQPISRDKVFCCPACGKGRVFAWQLTAFCPHCGLKLSKPEPPKEENDSSNS